MMRAAPRVLLVALLVAFAHVAAVMPTASALPADDEYLPVVVVMDTSSSMSESSGPNKTKIQGARTAVIDLVNALSPKTQFGLIAYPGSGRNVNGCSEGNLLVGVGDLDQNATAAAVRKLTPAGDTPTGPALQHAGRLVKNGPLGQGTIVLVSDGESNCGPNPCEVAKQLQTDGVEVRVNTVGLQISPQGAKELQCIADATGGRYVDAENAEQLQGALQDLGGARVTIDGMVSAQIAAVSGTGTSGPKAVFTVSNSGSVDAKDVRVSLDFRDKDNRPGAILVPRPVRFLGNIAKGQSRTVEFVIRPDPARLEQFSWTATATANNAAPAVKSGKTTVVEPFSQVTGLLAGKDNVVVLGDSYSSGTGAGTYQDGTDGANNTCRRSPDAYGPKLFTPAKTSILACHGAITADFFQWQNAGNWVPPQLQRLREMVTSGNAPQAVLMSIGGNDAKFGDLMVNCSLYPECGGYGDESIKELIVPLANSLLTVYWAVNGAVNDQTARDARGGAVAPIVVVPYPRLLPAEGSGQARDGCAFGISTKEITYLNRFQKALNDQIEAVVADIRKVGAPVYYATDVEDAFQPNHTICDDDSYVLAATRDNVLDKALTPDNVHPKATGWAAMARSISAWSSTQVALAGPSLPTWAPVERLIRDQRVKPWVPTPLPTVGGQSQFSGGGFEPNSSVIVRRESTPEVVAGAIADGNGNVDVTVPIPANTDPGRHRIVVVGFGRDGGLHTESREIWVVPPYAVTAVVLLGAGLIAVGVGVAGMRSARRRG